MEMRNDEKASRFVASLDGEDAYITYEKRNDKTLDLLHTTVPEEHEGKGVASALAEFALGYAREHGLKVIPSCHFVSTYIERHPGYEDVTAK